MKPDFAVYFDGNKLQGEEAAAIVGIRVYQTRFGASAFEIVVSDQDLKWQGKPTFTDCKEVKIELGVPGKMKKVFDGEVTAWRTELERSGPTVMVVRGLDRSHRMMRAHKTKTYAAATPLDCVSQIASDYGFTPKTNGGSPAPVKMFRFQANQTDFEFLRSMADLEGYMFWVEAKELHFERPTLSTTDDCEFSFGEDLKTFLPTANFRKPAVSVEVGAWDTAGKAEITGKAKTGDELWTVPGVKPGADVSKFTSSKTELSLVESQVGTQDHADTVAKAALTRRAMEFLTAEVEVQGNPDVKPGAMVNLKKVGEYSGHYYVTEANHFYDAAGYNVIFYVARDKWGNSSNTQAQNNQNNQTPPNQPPGGNQPPAPAPKPPGKQVQKSFIDFTLQDDQGKPLSDLQVKIHLASGETLEATTDGDGHVHIDEEPEGPYTVEILGAGPALTFIDIKVEDAEGNPITGASGSVELSDGSMVTVMTDAKGEVHLTDVPVGQYKFKLDDEGSGTGGTGSGSGGSGGTGTGTGSGGSGGTGTGTGSGGSGGTGRGTGSGGSGGTGAGTGGSGGGGGTGPGGSGSTATGGGSGSGPAATPGANQQGGGGGPGLGTILGVGAGAAAVAGVATAVAKSGKDAADAAPKGDDSADV